MSRLVWMGVGAAGGIYVYRRGQRSWERAKVRGVSGNAALLAATVAHWSAHVIAETQPGAPSAQWSPAPRTGPGRARSGPSVAQSANGGARSANGALSSANGVERRAPAPLASTAAESVGTWLLRRAAAARSD